MEQLEQLKDKVFREVDQIIPLKGLYYFRQRKKKGTLGFDPMLKLLAEEGYEIEITFKHPKVED